MRTTADRVNELRKVLAEAEHADRYELRELLARVVRVMIAEMSTSEPIEGLYDPPEEPGQRH